MEQEQEKEQELLHVFEVGAVWVPKEQKEELAME